MTGRRMTKPSGLWIQAVLLVMVTLCSQASLIFLLPTLEMLQLSLCYFAKDKSLLGSW